MAHITQAAQLILLGYNVAYVDLQDNNLVLDIQKLRLHSRPKAS